MKMEGGTNDLIDRIADDPEIPITKEEIMEVLDPALYTGRSASQVDTFLKEIVNPVLARYTDNVKAELNV